MLFILSSILLIIVTLILIFLGWLYFYELYVDKKISDNKNQIQILPVKLLNSNEIKFLTFNVWGLPIWLPNIDKIKRYNKIPDSIINVNAGIICLQEAYDLKLRNKIIQRLKSANYIYNEEYYCNSQLFLFIKRDCFGGLMTFSKYPIKSEKFYPHQIHNGMTQDEKFGKKGFLITEIKTPLGDMFIINIHLNSGRNKIDETIRLDQIKYLAKVIDSSNISEKPIILQGDFNLVHPNIAENKINLENYLKSEVYRYITEEMFFVDVKAKINEEDISYDAINNPYAAIFYNSFEKKQKFDYCFYHLPKNFKVIYSKSETIFKRPLPISDHYGIFTIMGFEKIE